MNSHKKYSSKSGKSESHFPVFMCVALWFGWEEERKRTREGRQQRVMSPIGRNLVSTMRCCVLSNLHQSEKTLNARITQIGDNDLTARSHCDAKRIFELPLTAAKTAPFVNERPITAENLNAIVGWRRAVQKRRWGEEMGKKKMCCGQTSDISANSFRHLV